MDKFIANGGSATIFRPPIFGKNFSIDQYNSDKWIGKVAEEKNNKKELMISKIIKSRCIDYHKWIILPEPIFVFLDEDDEDAINSLRNKNKLLDIKKCA
jgi:hypothetical protein